MEQRSTIDDQSYDTISDNQSRQNQEFNPALIYRLNTNRINHINRNITQNNRKIQEKQQNNRKIQEKQQNDIKMQEKVEQKHEEYLQYHIRALFPLPEITATYVDIQSINIHFHPLFEIQDRTTHRRQDQGQLVLQNVQVPESVQKQIQNLIIKVYMKKLELLVDKRQIQERTVARIKQVQQQRIQRQRQQAQQLAEAIRFAQQQKRSDKQYQQLMKRGAIQQRQRQVILSNQIQEYKRRVNQQINRSKLSQMQITWVINFINFEPVPLNRIIQGNVNMYELMELDRQAYIRSGMCYFQQSFIRVRGYIGLLVRNSMSFQAQIASLSPNVFGSRNNSVIGISNSVINTVNVSNILAENTYMDNNVNSNNNISATNISNINSQHQNQNHNHNHNLTQNNNPNNRTTNTIQIPNNTQPVIIPRIQIRRNNQNHQNPQINSYRTITQRTQITSNQQLPSQRSYNPINNSQQSQRSSSNNNNDSMTQRSSSTNSDQIINLMPLQRNNHQVISQIPHSNQITSQIPHSNQVMSQIPLQNNNNQVIGQRLQIRNNQQMSQRAVFKREENPSPEFLRINKDSTPQMILQRWKFCQAMQQSAFNRQQKKKRQQERLLRIKKQQQQEMQRQRVERERFYQQLRLERQRNQQYQRFERQRIQQQQRFERQRIQQYRILRQLQTKRKQQQEQKRKEQQEQKQKEQQERKKEQQRRKILQQKQRQQELQQSKRQHQQQRIKDLGFKIIVQPQYKDSQQQQQQ